MVVVRRGTIVEGPKFRKVFRWLAILVAMFYVVLCLVLGFAVPRFLIRVSDNLKQTRASAVVPKGLPEALERHVDALAGNPEHDGAIRKRNYRDVNALMQAQHYVQGEFKTLEDG